MAAPDGQQQVEAISTPDPRGKGGNLEPVCRGAPCQELSLQEGIATMRNTQMEQGEWLRQYVFSLSVSESSAGVSDRLHPVGSYQDQGIPEQYVESDSLKMHRGEGSLDNS